ncbi:MAG: hypothetical protein KJN90_07715, partial [Gammaproteobacteria bacterium]|nr:hypothetical protein [Gammaproteobacteria bacterium]
MFGRSNLWGVPGTGIIVTMMDGVVKKSATALLALCFLLFMQASAQQAGDAGATEFLRFLEGQGEFAGELQTSVTTYQNDQGIEVDLVATVHMADQAYYEGLNDYFSTRDAVLYELVADENVRPNGQGRSRGNGFIGFMQTSMTRLLGLSYQLDVINYAQPNFFHADLEPQELDA